MTLARTADNYEDQQDSLKNVSILRRAYKTAIDNTETIVLLMTAAGIIRPFSDATSSGQKDRFTSLKMYSLGVGVRTVPG